MSFLKTKQRGNIPQKKVETLTFNCLAKTNIFTQVGVRDEPSFVGVVQLDVEPIVLNYLDYS